MDHWGWLLTLALLLEGSRSFCLAAAATSPRPHRSGVTVNMTGPVVNADGTDFSFTCQASSDKVAPPANVSYQWMMDGVLVHKDTVAGFHTPSHVNKDIWKGHLGQSLHCAVVVTDAHGHNHQAFSQSYTGEIKVEQARITLVEGETAQVNVTSTLPVTCDCPGTNPLTHKCTLPIEFQPPTNAPLSVVNQCEAYLRSADWDAGKRLTKTGFQVTTTRDLAHKAEHDYTVQLVVRAADQCQDSIWSGAKLSPVQIHTKDEEVKVCSHSGDPHVNNFDNKRYSFYPPGTYRMHKSMVGNAEFEVQNILYPKTGVSICATAVRLGSYTVMLYMCDGSQDGHIPVLLANRRQVPNNLLIERKGNEYQITASTGQVVTVRQSKRRLDVTVMALTSQVEPANTTTCSSYLPTSNRKDAMPEVQKLMVQGRENIFNKMTSKRHYFPVDVIASADEAEDDAGDDNSKYCLCDQGSAIKCEYFVNFWDPSRQDAGWQIVKPHFTELDENTINNKWDGDLNKWNGVQHSWPTWSGITEAKATATCDSAIRNYTLADCLAIMQDVFKHYLDACKEDILIMDDLDQTDSMVADFENACVARALKNPTNYVTDPTTGKVTGPKPQFGRERCPNHCSQRGSCQRGLCQCRGHYKGADCSLDHDGSPHITSILGGPVCDRQGAACLPVVLGVDNVEENDDAYFCQVSRMKKGSRGRHVTDHHAHPRLFPVRFLSRNAVLCNITLHDSDEDRSSSSGFQIVLKRLEIDSLTATRSSNTVQYLIYDGTCRYCDDTFTCYLRDETCHIDGHCVENGVGRDKINHYACHAEKNPLHWTQ